MVDETTVSSEEAPVAGKRVQKPSEEAPKPKKVAKKKAVKKKAAARKVLPDASPMPPETFVATIMAGFVGQQGMQAFSRITLNALTNPDTLTRMYEGYLKACAQIRSNLE